ncbi:MAG: hypothetical protein BWX79_02791 [Alphaproteobacteria bacterium ADurb.Bin100]|nr:MAG: hypothetical protein BWX79_02791 [Alphaproteobacteria bacterium ADurb.Bin100]
MDSSSWMGRILRLRCLCPLRTTQFVTRADHQCVPWRPCSRMYLPARPDEDDLYRPFSHPAPLVAGGVARGIDDVGFGPVPRRDLRRGPDPDADCDRRFSGGRPIAGQDQRRDSGRSGAQRAFQADGCGWSGAGRRVARRPAVVAPAWRRLLGGRQRHPPARRALRRAFPAVGCGSRPGSRRAGLHGACRRPAPGFAQDCRLHS